MILADLGAEVIKVENPKGGDDTRHWGPPDTGGESAYYLCANRNKRSIAVDLASADGQALVRELAKRQSLDSAIRQISAAVDKSTNSRQSPWRQGDLSFPLYLAGQPRFPVP